MVIVLARIAHIIVEAVGNDRTPATEEETSMAHAFLRILKDTANGIVSFIEGDEEVEIDEDCEKSDPDWTEVCDDEDEGNDSTDKPSAEYVAFSDSRVSLEQVQKAIHYYRSSAKGHRVFSAMSSNFRFIRTPYHLQKLLRIEKEHEIRADLRARREQLVQLLKDEVQAKFDAGISLHDIDLQLMAVRINKEKRLLDNFVASSTWISRFKRCARICSRRITTFTSKQNFRRKEEIEKNAQDFVSNIRAEIQNLPLSNLANADQSGFFKELHSPRSLAPIGVKRVERIAQTISGTTHSFTILPLLFADGHLGEKLFVVLQEPGGRFPRTPHFSAQNLEVRAGSSHIMTKNHMLEWFETCVFTASSPSSVFLLVDSWPAFRDVNTINTTVPANNHLDIRHMPPGSTSMIQPLDVYFFRPFKQMVKRIHGYVVAHDVPFAISKRDNLLKVISQVYFQFTAPCFRRMLQYPWFKAGYFDDHPGFFQTPLQICFPGHLNSCCEIGCAAMSFIVCAHCSEQFCFMHFFETFHHC